MRLIIVGAGGLARSIYSCFKDKYEFKGFYEQPRQPSETLYGLPVSTTDRRDCDYAMGIGNDVSRKKALDDLFRGRWVTLIANTAHVSRFATIGEGNVFMPNVFVDPDAEIGRLNTFMNGCFVGHHAKIGDYCTIGQNTVIGGFTKVGNLSYMGSNVSVVNEHWRDNPIVLGKGCRVGSNAVVVKRSVGEGETVVGVPARPIQNH